MNNEQTTQPSHKESSALIARAQAKNPELFATELQGNVVRSKGGSGLLKDRDLQAMSDNLATLVDSELIQLAQLLSNQSEQLDKEYRDRLRNTSDRRMKALALASYTQKKRKLNDLAETIMG